MAGGIGTTKTLRLRDGAVLNYNPVRTLAKTAGYFTAGDRGFLSESTQLDAASGTYTLPTAGLVHLSKLHLPNPATITNLVTYVTTAGATLTASQCFAALYTAGGVKVGITGNQATLWATAGLQTMPLAVPYVATAGDYYIALWFNGTTGPTLGTTGNNTIAAFVNAGFATAASVAATADASITTAASAVATLGTKTAIAKRLWVAVS